MMKMTHIEVVSRIEEKTRVYLFDYRERDPLDGSARCLEIQI